MTKSYISSGEKKRQNSHPLLSIVVLTYNSQKYIKDCLNSLFRANHPACEYIVVDNGSSDQTLEIILKRFPEVKIIQNNNTGYAGGFNLGASKSRGKYLAIITPDTKVSPNWIFPLLKRMNDPEVAVCQPKVMLLKEPALLNLTGQTTHFLGFNWISDYRKGLKNLPERELTSFSGALFLIKRAVFDQLGGFDKSFFMYYEDGDLAWRIRLSGYKIIFVPGSAVFHDYKFQPEENIQKIRQKFYYLERNRLVMMLKNYSLKTLLLLLPGLVFLETGMGIYFLSQGWWLEKGKGYLWIFKNLGQILSARKTIQASRKIDDRVFMENFQGQIKFEEFNNAAVKFLVNPLLGGYWVIIRKLI